MVDECVDAPIIHSLCHYWAQNPQADLVDIVFKAESLLYIQKCTGTALNKKQGIWNAGKHFDGKLWNNAGTLIVIVMCTITSALKSSMCWSK